MSPRRGKKDKKWILMKFGFFSCFAVSIFALVWLRTAVVNLEYKVGELDKQKVELVREKKLVIARRASFYSAKKIEDMAIKRLGMRLPERENIFFVKRTKGAGPYRASMGSGLNGASNSRALWKQQENINERVRMIKLRDEDER